MRTVNEVSKLTGVSIRTLHYYDTIGLLKPTDVTESGYRLYDDIALERLQSILLFRELGFPLKEIKVILDSPDFDRSKALEQQITLLEMKREHFYHCTPEILQGLGKMYGAEGEFRQNIDKVGGTGTADFTARAIECYCK